ncbi:hypothetical protein ASG42_24455 [Rhizobium sp. Leaf391]|uniref:hypothetical protein n=1 Tax=Rhizobium sp. Leaf391 TaxID=1736360 RepID=UPI000715A72C|nr:hypothetical protein [Rhizobium sp. Leaf391]KQT03166.1 hypothetical protein ASG42_24455 [Rhizobium sp. Leaf391]
MQQHQVTPAQKTKLKKQEERRRSERRQREDEYRRRIERLRRQIEEALRRRRRMLSLFLLALLAIQESILKAFVRSFTYRPDPDPADWTPSPESDFAAQTGHDDYCDGYSYAQWTKMVHERGIRVSRKAELQETWKADPERENFPQRYKDWGYRPYLGEIMNDLSIARWQSDALTALKLMSPSEVHKYLDESYAADPGDLLMCRADLSADIIKNFERAAIQWEIRKAREAEEARQEKELSRKSNNEDGNPEPK